MFFDITFNSWTGVENYFDSAPHQHDPNVRAAANYVLFIDQSPRIRENRRSKEVLNDPKANHITVLLPIISKMTPFWRESPVASWAEPPGRP